MSSSDDYEVVRKRRSRAADILKALALGGAGVGLGMWGHKNKWLENGLDPYKQDLLKLFGQGPKGEADKAKIIPGLGPRIVDQAAASKSTGTATPAGSHLPRYMRTSLEPNYDGHKRTSQEPKAKGSTGPRSATSAPSWATEPYDPLGPEVQRYIRELEAAKAKGSTEPSSATSADPITKDPRYMGWLLDTLDKQFPGRTPPPTGTALQLR